MLKNLKKCSAMLILSALFSGIAVNAEDYLNLKTDSNQIYSSRRVLCEKCGRQHTHYFYISGGEICGYICNGEEKDATFKGKTSTKGSYALHVSNKAYFVKLLKSFFDSSNWTTLENPDGTTIYTITPEQDITLTIKFENESNFTISCGRLNKSFRVLENNEKTSASIIFKAFECFCEEKQKVSYFESNTPEIYNPKSTVGLNASIFLESDSASTNEASSNFGAPSTPASKRNRSDSEGSSTPATKKSCLAPSMHRNANETTSQSLCATTPLKNREYFLATSGSNSASTNQASSKFVAPSTPASKCNRKGIPSTSIREITKKSRLTPSIHRNANETLSQSLCTTTPLKNRERFLATSESESKRTNTKRINGVSCTHREAVLRLKDYILDGSNWHENPTPVELINAQVQIPTKTPRGWAINLRGIFEAIPAFFDGKISQERINLPFSSPTQPFYFKNTITYDYPLYCLTSNKPDKNLMQKAYEYILKMLDIQELPSYPLIF